MAPGDTGALTVLLAGVLTEGVWALGAAAVARSVSVLAGV